jgi:hypothetical protein
MGVGMGMGGYGRASAHTDGADKVAQGWSDTLNTTHTTRRAGKKTSALAAVALVLGIGGATWEVCGARTQERGGLEVVVLSTFPRSGTSWVRELTRGASGIVTGASSRSMEKYASEIVRLRAAPPTDTSHVTNVLLAHKLMRGYKFLPNTDNSSTRAADANDSSTKHRLMGVKDSVLSDMPERMLEECNAIPDVNLTDGGVIAPLLIKSHFPAIQRRGHGAKLITDSNRRIHLVRNPYDTIVSGFHGSNMVKSPKKSTRWAELVSAAAKNKTTVQFEQYVVPPPPPLRS